MIKILAFILIAFAIVNCEDAANDDAKVIEVETNDVTVHFMDFKRAELLEVLPKLKSTLGSLLSKYCSKTDDNDKCPDSSSGNYTSDSIEFVGSTDKERFVEENRYIIAKLKAFSIEDSVKHYLTKSTLEDFLTKSRNEIATEAQVQIAYLDNKFIYPKRNNLDNYIIIPISIGFVLVLIVFNFICQRKSERSARQEYLDQIKKREKPQAHKKDASQNTDEALGLIAYNDKPDSTHKFPFKSATHNNNTHTTVNNELIEKPRNNNKRKPEFIAGKVNEVIGSSSNLTQSKTEWTKNTGLHDDSSFGFNMDKYQPRYLSSNVIEMNSSNAANIRRKSPTHLSSIEKSDTKVAQRLASQERLPSTYDNLKDFNEHRTSQPRIFKSTSQRQINL